MLLASLRSRSGQRLYYEYNKGVFSRVYYSEGTHRHSIFVTDHEGKVQQTPSEGTHDGLLDEFTLRDAHAGTIASKKPCARRSSIDGQHLKIMPINHCDVCC